MSYEVKRLISDIHSPKYWENIALLQAVVSAARECSLSAVTPHDTCSICGGAPVMHAMGCTMASLDEAIFALDARLAEKERVYEELRVAFSNVVDTETAAQILNCIVPVVQRAVDEAVAGAYLAAKNEAWLRINVPSDSTISFQTLNEALEEMQDRIISQTPADARTAFEAAVKREVVCALPDGEVAVFERKRAVMKIPDPARERTLAPSQSKIQTGAKP